MWQKFCFRSGIQGAIAVRQPLARCVKNDTMSVIQVCTEVPAAVGLEMIQMTIRITMAQPMIFAAKRSLFLPGQRTPHSGNALPDRSD